MMSRKKLLNIRPAVSGRSTRDRGYQSFFSFWHYTGYFTKSNGWGYRRAHTRRLYVNEYFGLISHYKIGVIPKYIILIFQHKKGFVI
eukprot:UN09603